jgi:hypothetical protein
VRQDSALKQGVELVFDEARQCQSGASVGVHDEARRVLLHQEAKPGLLGAVPLVVDWGTIWRPLGLPASA